MKSIKKLVASSILAVMCLSLIGCGAKDTGIGKAGTDTTILATIGDRNITLGEINKEMFADIKGLQDEFGEDFESEIDKALLDKINENRGLVLNQLIQEVVVINKAKELNLIPQQEELDEMVSKKEQELIQGYGSKENLELSKEQYGFTDETFKTFLENSVIQEIVVENQTKDVTVSDKEISEFYDKNITTFFTQKPGAESQHILFEKKEDAQKCLDSIKEKTTTFENEFKKYSENTDQNQRPLAENLGYIEYEQEGFDKDFLKGFKTTKEGEVSEPIESSFGFHLIQVKNIKNKDTITPFKDVKDAILSQITFDKRLAKFNTLLEGWKKEQEVKITAEKINYKTAIDSAEKDANK